MLNISLPVANALSGLANLSLVIGTVLVLAGTIGAIWTSGIRERYADERISANEAQTSTAKADAARATENTEAIKRSNLKLQAEVERERSARFILEGKQTTLQQHQAQRRLTPEQKHNIIAAISGFHGQKVDIRTVLGDADSLTYTSDFVAVFRAAGWNDGGGTGINQVVNSGENPVGIGVLLKGTDPAHPPPIPPGLDALLNILVQTGLMATKAVTLDPGVEDGKITFSIGVKPPLEMK